MSIEEQQKFDRARHDYGFNHGFNSRGIAPSFLGADSLPQGIADLHWALHGIAHNMDDLDGRMKSYEGNIQRIIDSAKEGIIKDLGKSLIQSRTPLTSKTAYIGKIFTTRSRIFSDSSTNETLMDPVQRQRGFTKNYHWISYTQKNPTCEGEYDKVIDFNYISDREQDDSVDSLFVTKGKVILDKCGLLNRVHIIQKDNSMVIYYLLTQTIPTGTGVGYTGAIKRVEVDRDSNIISDRTISLNHTPLVLLGAFSFDTNNEKEMIQYISTDYKVYQNINGTDLDLGTLPPEVVNLIDPVNDIISDTKQAYIITYNNDGTIKMPLKGFTLLDTMDGNDILKKFSIVSLNSSDRLMSNLVSISPRTQTNLIGTFDVAEPIYLEGGYYVEMYDKNDIVPNVAHSHIFLISSTEEIYDKDRFSPNIMTYRSTKPSEFSMKRERDYLEFPQITFTGGLSKMYPEISKDFGIPDDTMFTVEYDMGRNTETLTIHLREPFILERSLEDKDVMSRTGYTVLHNSDYVKDIAEMGILSVYNKLDFVTKSPFTRNYFEKHDQYDSDFSLPKYMRYRVTDPSDVEERRGTTEITYFDRDRKFELTFHSHNSVLHSVKEYNDNNGTYVAKMSKISPTVKGDYLADIITNTVLYVNKKTRDYRDYPYGIDGNDVVINRPTSNGISQHLYHLYEDGTLGVDFQRYLDINAHQYGEWFGTGYTPTVSLLNIPGYYNAKVGMTGAELGSKNPGHKVFEDVISNNVQVEGVDRTHTHIIYTLTNSLGLSMQYHNIAVRESSNDKLISTAQPYRLMYDKWIPGKYIGNSDYPLGPDNDSVTQYILDKLKILDGFDDRIRALEDKLADYENLKNVVKQIVSSLTRSGGWDPNGNTASAASTPLSGSITPGKDIAYGNINLFGGTPDGDHFIRTNTGQTEDDLAGGI